MKLLNKTLKPFALYSLLVFGLSVPAYFFIVNFIWKRELDKHHMIIRNKIEKEINTLHLSDSALSGFLHVWNKIQPRTTLIPTNEPRSINDSIYTTIRYDEDEAEIEQFRGIVSTIHINKKPYHLMVETNMEEFYETLIIIVFITILSFLLLLAGINLLNRRLSLKIWKPFYDTLQKLKSFDINRQDQLHFQSSDIEEFETLNVELSKLISNNSAAYRQQKEFTENASHELQTPLALLKTKVDLLLQDASLTRDQSENIASLDIPLSKVSRINKNLLLLANLENKQFVDHELVQVSKIITDTITSMKDHLASKNLSLSNYIEEDIFINANSSLCEVMVANLLLNAIRHNIINGKINATLSGKIFTVKNTGTGPLNPDTLFKRFINSSNEMPSSGLGLSIVKEICKTHQWNISYEFVNLQHVFTVSF